jgi:lipopolysaccharide export system permease protein
MRLLDRYLLRELLVPLGYCLGGFLIFWISFDLISELNTFQEREMSATLVAYYYWLRMPEFLVLVFPIALLLSLLYALTNHARHQELTAIRAAGVSMMRLGLPYLGVGLFFSLAAFAVNEMWVPRTSEAADTLRSNPDQAGAPGWHRNLHFRNARENRIWTIGGFHLQTHELAHPQVSWESADGGRKSLIARSGRWEEGGWVFQDVQQFIYPPGTLSPRPREQSPELDDPAAAEGEAHEAAQQFDYTLVRTNRLAVPEFWETPEQIKSEIKVAPLLSRSVRAAKEAHLSLRDIHNYRRLHPDMTSGDRALLSTQLHARLAAPWTSLVVVLIAFPFGAPSGRRNVFVGVASSIFICFGFFILLRFGLALGTGGYIPPWLAAWMPNLLFATAGLWLTQRVR